MRRQLRWSVAATCALIAGCAANSTSAVTRASGVETVLKVGVWGSRLAMLSVAENEVATLELPCAHGTIPGPLTIDSDGKVDWPGQFVQERGGAVPENESGGENVPVRYRGTLTADTLTLDIVTGGRSMNGRLTLVYGTQARIAKCQ